MRLKKGQKEDALRKKLMNLEQSMTSEQEFPAIYMVKSMLEVMGGVQLSIDENLKHKFASDFITLLNAYREED